MFNLIQLQDRLRGFSEDQLKQFLQRPDPSIPDFMVMAALDEKNDAKVQEAQMKAQNQPSVREEMLAVAGLPAMEAGQMASAMAPKSDVRRNTGGDEMMTMARLAEDMPMEDDMEEDEELDIVETPVRRANFGGLMQFGSRMSMAAPLARRIMPRPGLGASQPAAQDLENQLQQSQVARRGYGGGLGGFGRDIMGRVTEQKRGEVDNFLGEVEGMAEDRFDIELDQQQRGMSGKGQVPIPRALPMRAMNEGGLAGMYFGGRPGDLNPFLDFSGNFIPKVKPRPPSSSIYVDKGTVINEQEDWDKNEGKYYNIDGTLKDEFKNNVASPATDTGGQPDSVRDAQRMMDINEIPERPEKKDDKDDPDPDGTGGGNYLSDLTASLDKMREDQKEQMAKNQALGIMLEGLKLSRRGVIDDETGKGLQFMGQQQAKVQDRLAQLQGLEAKIGIAGATLAQKDRATKAALEKAMKKGSSMTTAQLASEIRGYSADIGKLRKQLGEETISFDEAETAKIQEEIKRLAELRSLYVSDLKGRYGGDILDNEFLKTLLDENQKDK